MGRQRSLTYHAIIIVSDVVCVVWGSTRWNQSIDPTNQPTHPTQPNPNQPTNHPKKTTTHFSYHREERIAARLEAHVGDTAKDFETETGARIGMICFVIL
jgi:hypothetical protein